jgi:hypothetical protein
MKLSKKHHYCLLSVILLLCFNTYSFAQPTPALLETNLINGAIKETVLALKNTTFLQNLQSKEKKFWQGFLYQYTNQFDSASNYYNQYLNESDAKEFYVKQAEKGLEETRQTIKYNSHNVFVDVVKTKGTSKPLYSILESKIKDSSFYTLSVKFDTLKLVSNKFELIKSFAFLSKKNINIISLAAISNDGKTIFLNAKLGDRKIIVYGVITRLNAIALYPLPAIISAENLQGLAISPDKKSIYFSKSTSGVYDLYYVKLTDDNIWTSPIMLPKEINTDNDESFPVLSKDGLTLYYSSNKMGGFGGYDIYQTTFDSSQNRWNEPRLLPFPINSSWDDLMPILDKQKNVTHFVSNRNLKSNDLNVFEAKKTKKILLKLKVYTTDSSAGISDLNIRLSPNNDIKITESTYLRSNSNVYFDSVFIGRHYDMEILDDKDTISMSQINCLYDSDTSHYIYIDVSILKHAQLLSNEETLPFYARYSLHYSENGIQNNSSFKKLMKLMKEHKFYHLKIFFSKHNVTAISKKRMEDLKNQISKNGIDVSRIEILHSDVSHTTPHYIETHLYIK